MQLSILANQSTYPDCTYQRFGTTRATGGKAVRGIIAEYIDCPVAFVNTTSRADWSDDGIYKHGRGKAYVPERFFEVHQFSPSLNDIIIRQDVKYRVTDVKDYTYHPHIGVYSLSLKRIEYHD